MQQYVGSSTLLPLLHQLSKLNVREFKIHSLSDEVQRKACIFQKHGGMRASHVADKQAGNVKAISSTPDEAENNCEDLDLVFVCV